METTATATAWSTASTDSASLEPSHAVHTPPRTAWPHDGSDRISSPELDDTTMSYEYHHHHQSQSQQPQQGVCQFVHTQCEKELFTTEYLRSNKASGHKNLRCFPHCCGGHNPKSFCGSGLVVECFLPKCQIVLGRFEEVAKPKPKVSSASSSTSTSTTGTASGAAATDESDAVTTIAVGYEYSRKELFDEVKVPDQPFGKWFRGTIVPKAADRACFLLNGNRQSWHYGWQSSRLNCKNLHVFKVYVFNQSETSPSALQCVAELASPAFRISSSRKARKTVRSPVMHPLPSPTDLTTMPSNNSSGAESRSGGATTSGGSSRVPSIDELLSKSSTGPIAASERFPSQQRRSLVEPLTLLEQQQQHARAAAAATASSGYQRGYPTLQRHSIAVSSLHAAAAAAAAAAVAADNAHARRERKRLTRSASLKSDYYATVAFPPLQPPVQQQPPAPTPSFSLAATHPPPQFAYQQQQQQQQQQRMAPLPSVAYMNGTRMLNARRSSLAALPMPSPAPLAPQPHPSSSGGGGATAVTTPIMDMMQLRLESPHPQDAYRQQHMLQQQQQQQRLSLSAFTPSSSLHQHAYASAKPLSFTRRDFAASWSAGGPGPLSAAPAPAPPVYFPMIPASSPEGYLNRKRNRSTDSDKGLLAAIQASEALLASARGDGAPGMSHHTTSGGATAMDTGDEPALASVDETDSVDLHRRARVLQLAFTIVKRIHRFEEVSKASASATTPRVYRHSFEMVIPASRSSSSSSAAASSKAPTLVQIPLSNHQILHLCSSLVSVCTSLLRNGVLLDIRQRLVEYAQAGVDLYSAYAQLVDYIDDAVHELVCQLPKRQRARDASGNADTDDAEQWDLYDLLKNAEAWLIQEPWWCATDDDDDSASRRPNQRDDSASSSGNQHADLPYYHRFADFYEAIQSALPSPRDLEVAASLRDAALNGVRGLTGEWLRQGSLDDLSAQRPKSAAASASASASLSWLARQIHGHMTQVFHLTETATTMTLALPQSLISSEAVFLFDLDRQEPTVVVPQDYFPFGWTRKRLLVAYRAWRVRGIGDENGSAVAVQFMRWPDEPSARGENTDASDDESVDDDDDDDDDNEPEEEPLEPGRRNGSAAAAALLRTRVTIYFSVFSHNRLQVRTIVEGSMGAALPSPSSSAAGSPPPASMRRGQPTEADMMQYFKSPSSWELMSQVTHEYERKSLREIL